MFDSVLFPGRPFSRLTSSPRRQVDTLSIGRFRLFIFIFFSFSPINVSGRKWNANSRSEIIIFPDFNTHTHVCLYRRIISFRVLSSLFHPSRTHHCSLTPWRLDVTSWEKFFYDRKIRGNSHQGKLGDLSGDRAFYPISAISLDSLRSKSSRAPFAEPSFTRLETLCLPASIDRCLDIYYASCLYRSRSSRVTWFVLLFAPLPWRK